MPSKHNNGLVSGLLCLLLVTSSLCETIKLSPFDMGGKNDLFSSLQSTWNSGSMQKQQLGNLFSTDNIFGSVKTSGTGVGNNILQGSNNQMQGVNNRISGSNNSLIGMNSTVVGDLNKAFGVSNTIFGSMNEITKGNNNQIKGSSNLL